MKLILVLLLIISWAQAAPPVPGEHASVLSTDVIYPLRGCTGSNVVGENSEVRALSYGFYRYNASVIFKEKVSKVLVLSNSREDSVGRGCLGLVKTSNLEATAAIDYEFLILKKFDLAMVISDTKIFGSQGCAQEGRVGFMSDVEVLSDPIPHAFPEGSGTMVRVINNTGPTGVKKGCKGVVYSSELIKNHFLEKK